MRSRRRITREDSVAEWLTWASYLGAAALLIPVTRAFLGQQRPFVAALYGVLAVSLAFVAMEEIIWGQRVFGLGTPEVFAANTQGELNLHNLPAVQRYLHRGYISIGLLAGLAWIAMPAIRRVRPIAWLEDIAPPWTLATWFLPVSLIYAFYELAAPLEGSDGQKFFGCFTWGDQELVELLLAIGFFLYAAQVRRKQSEASARG